MLRRIGLVLVGLAMLFGLVAPGATADVSLKAPSDLANAVPKTPQDQEAPVINAACGVPATATNANGQVRVTATSDPVFYANTAAWADLQCGTISVTVPRGKRAAIVTQVDAEVLCLVGVENTQWCQGRVLVNGIEASPRAPEPDSFSWAHSTTDAAAWESNAFTRSIMVSCPSTNPLAVCVYSVRTQVRNHAANMNFRVDDLSVHVQVTNTP